MGPRQLGKQQTFFLEVMMFIAERPEKAQKCLCIVDPFGVVPLNHGFKHIKRTDNDLGIMPQ
jgi:hypothetical protein